MKYFSNFQKLNYTIGDQSLEMMNIFVRPEGYVVSVPEAFTEFTTFIEDGFSPDKAARKIYKNDDYFWFVLIQNNILDFYKQWPLSYFYWKKELSEIHPGETFYSRYILDLQVGDLLVKVNNDPGENNVEFDENNCSVIVDFDPFLRSFDAVKIKGSISEDDQCYILRKTGISYQHIQTPNGGSTHVIQRKEDKMNSLAEFGLNIDNQTKIPLSPYSDETSTNLISSTVVDIFQYDCLLTNYIKRNLPNNIITKSFSDIKENEWIFKKNIKTIPVSDLLVLDNAYVTLFTEE